VAARYATDTFVIQLPSGASELVIEGSLRDSAEAVVTAAASRFSTSAPVLGQGHVSALLFGHLQAHPRGSEV
jgi:hypothetical protein